MGPKARILAVDDQLYFRSFVEGLLAEAGYVTTTAESGEAALECLEASPAGFDLVLMDLVMPGMDGVECVRRIRDRWPEKPVLVVTGVGDVRSAVAAMKLGAADYLLKPIDRDELLRAIEAVLERRRMRNENERLVDENLEFMAQLSLYERAMPLVAARRSGEAARQWLGLLCTEVGAELGAVWVREAVGAELVLRASHGDAPLDAEPDRFEALSTDLDGALRAGDPAELAGALWVPAVRGGDLFAVARLDAQEGARFGGQALGVCRKLGQIASFALESALRAERLESQSLDDARTELPRRAFLERVVTMEIEKAQRYARRLSLLTIELETGNSPLSPPQLGAVIDEIEGSIRSTDSLAIDAELRFWALLSDTDPLGSVILKRRISQRTRALLSRLAPGARLWLGSASYPLDGASFDSLAQAATARAQGERESLLRTLQINEESPLGEIAERLLERAAPMPPPFVTEIADLLIGELSSRPGERGVLFLAPGDERPSFLGPLALLANTDPATEVFVATDGDTLPQGTSVHPLPLPPDMPRDTTWIVRFGEAPPYALVAAPPERDGRRNVFHTADRALVEDLAFRLRAEVGLEVRG